MRAKIRLIVILATLLLGLLSVQTLAQSNNANPRAFGKGVPNDTSELPQGAFKSRLLSLPPQSRGKAMEVLQAFAFSELDLEFMRIDDYGGVYYADTVLPEDAKPEASDLPLPDAITAADTFLLHSRPGAPNVVYLDFDGHTISGTAWNDLRADPLYATAFDPSGDDVEVTPCLRPGTPPVWQVNFSSTELARIGEIWHRTAEDFAPWNIDVTTEEPDSFNSTTGRVLYTDDSDYCGDAMPSAGGGGVAYVVVFGNGNYHTWTSPALVYWTNLGPGSATYNHEAGTHEFGHNLGMAHDGTSSASYYVGHGSSDTSPVDLNSWAPIMGVGYYRNVTQWSKGDYPDAVLSSTYQTNADDIAVITGELGYRPDDHADVVGGGATALAVLGDGTINVTNPEDDPHYFSTDNKGVIEDRNDIDVFYFDTGAGAVSITVEPAWAAFYLDTRKRGANLDIKATLYDSLGAPVDSDDPLDDTDAFLSATVAAGRYYVATEGVGNPGNTNDSSNTNYGYDDYGSIGMYFISGTVQPTAADTTPPSPNPMTFAVVPVATGISTITMTATTATDASGFVEYYFNCVSGGPGCTPSGWQASTVFNAAGLSPSTNYTYAVQARDSFNNLTGFSAQSSATTDSVAPAAPSGLAATAVSQAQIDIGWSDNSDDETGFKISHSTDGSAYSLLTTTAASATSYSHTGSAPNSIHYYKVSATNAVGDSAEDGPVNATTWDTAPAAPAGLAATAVSFSQIDLDWTDNADNESGFEIERSPNGTDSWTQIATVGAGVTSYSNTGLGASTGFWYRVNATNSGGNVDSDYCNTASATTLEAPPGTPASLTATPVSSNQIDLQWADNADNENGFAVEFSTGSSSGPWSAAGNTAADETAFSHSSLNNSTQHWYRVKATHADGGVGDSAWSNIATATTFEACSATKSFTADQWEMFALPCNPGPGATIEQMFSELDPNDYGIEWAVFDLDENTDEFVLPPIDSIPQEGVGYWVWTPQAVTVLIEGYPFTQPTADIPLVNDTVDGFFNFVGYNRNDTIDWADVIVDHGNPNPPTVLQADPYGSGQDSGTLECDMPTPGNKCLMSRVMYMWTGSNFDTYDGETTGMEGTLEPFTSFWVKAFKPNLELRIPAPAAAPPAESPAVKPGNSGGNNRGRGKKQDSESWNIRLTAQSGNKKDKGNLLGQLPDSLDGLDSHDLEELAPFGGSYLSLVFTNPLFDSVDWGYTSDYRSPTSSPAGEWPFIVLATVDVEEVTLSWTGKAELFDNAWLLDEQTGDLIEIKPGESYTFFNETGEHRFTLIIE